MQVKQRVASVLEGSNFSPEKSEELNAILTVTSRSLERRLKKQGLADAPEAAERLMSLLRDRYVQEEQLMREDQWARIAESIQIAAPAGLDAEVAAKGMFGDTEDIEMDEATTEAVFRAVVKAVDRAEEENEPLPASVPKMLHRVFDADMRPVSYTHLTLPTKRIV